MNLGEHIEQAAQGERIMALKESIDKMDNRFSKVESDILAIRLSLAEMKAGRSVLAGVAAAIGSLIGAVVVVLLQHWMKGKAT